MSRIRVVLAVVVAVTFLAGLVTAVVPATPPAASAATSRPDAVRALLDRRARAVLERDEAAFAADLDPRADAGFRQRQLDLFRNLAGVPLAEWEYRLDGAADAPTGLELPAADEVWAPDVRLSYRLGGVDVEPSSQVMAYLFTRHDGRWYLNSDTALEPLGKRTWRGPWDFGPCQVRAGTGGFVLSHPGGEALASRALAELDGAVTAVTEVWGQAWARQVAVLVPASPDEMVALVGPGFATGAIAGVAVADRVDPDTRTARGQRVVLNPDSAGALSPLALRVLLRHEITHVATRGDTVDGAPMWVLEGFADYVGYRRSDVPPEKAAPHLAARVRRALPTALPSDADFRGDAMELAYQQAWSVNLYLASTLGEPGLVALHRRLARVRASEVDGVLLEATGGDTAALVRGWQDFLRRTFP
ncbi:basic secretory family protein [Saccharothrix sp. S26]|uniref:basic secretory family protein n=1 Tax=Saccharothrix sp. S26 TaxID=2907215 RepID=UPI001F32B62C|nr:basic secretory family protein [Saccharothrix sp. S26]MCE6997703.1 basic secretory family protein [Saccharothrix sp. S26]